MPACSASSSPRAARRSSSAAPTPRNIPARLSTTTSTPRTASGKQRARRASPAPGARTATSRPSLTPALPSSTARRAQSELSMRRSLAARFTIRARATTRIRATRSPQSVSAGATRPGRSLLPSESAYQLSFRVIFTFSSASISVRPAMASASVQSRARTSA